MFHWFLITILLINSLSLRVYFIRDDLALARTFRGLELFYDGLFINIGPSKFCCRPARAVAVAELGNKNDGNKPTLIVNQ